MNTTNKDVTVKTEDDKAKTEDVKAKIARADLAQIKEYKLSRPVKIADKTYDVLSLDFDKLTGEDMETAAALPGATPTNGATNEYSKTYLMYIAARAAGITINEIRKFPISDSTGLTMLAYGFLMTGLSQNIHV
jgi:hypothetical protein